MTVEDAKEWMRREGNPEECVQTLVGCSVPDMFFFRDSLGAVIVVRYDVKTETWSGALVP